MRIIALSLICVAALATPAAAQIATPQPSARIAALSEQTISYGELAAIGAGAIIGTSVATLMVDHGLGIVGTLLGAWAGDYYFHRYATPN